MLNFLINIFIKDKDNMMDKKVRENYGMLAAMVGIVSNLFLVGVKVAIGILINSLGVVADGLNNLSDMVSSIVSLISFKISNKPPDKGHPFGHGRIEYISALIVSFLILLVGYEILKQSVGNIMNPQTLDFNPLLIGFLILSVFIKVWQMLVNKRIGKRINSDTLIATSTDSRNDVLVTSGMIIAIIFSFMFNINVDGYISLIIGLFILYSGFNIGKDVVSVLLGQSIKKEDADRIKAAVLKYDGILGVHDLISHTYGPTYSMVSLHAEVSENVSIEISHELIDKIEREVGQELGLFLVIHMDPVTMNDKRLDKLKLVVNDVLSNFEGELSAHDFRLVDGIDQINFIFDLELPFGFDEGEKINIENKLTEEVKKRDSRYNLVINMEYSFIG
ncbi:MAG: cation diffusion facilitator family transporter [Firmicutes bacterium]|nr:cation diffusion facilitator family transporter [Bacillota bacterium]